MHVAVITGSRDWTERSPIEVVLTGKDMLIVGDCPDQRTAMDIRKGLPMRSADAIAAEIAREWDIMLVVLRADWKALDSKAGPIRNQAMADRARAELDAGMLVSCFAFPLPESKGTWDCAKRLEKHGLRVTVYSPLPIISMNKPPPPKRVR